LYAYPIHFTDELITTLATAKKIIPYLDLPLQHINDRVLRRMQRKVNRSGTEELLDRLRTAIPRLALRTTFIVGFPGETDAEFEELVEFVRTARFERAGVFPYSFEPGTPATRLDGHLPEEVKTQRRDRLMETQQEVAFEWSGQQVGREMDVIIDGPDPEVPNHALARSHADAPDIDGTVRVKGKGLRAGDFVRVKVTGADGYDLAARAIGSGW
jgi:ribosomal protein S12 methylthiotransferase